MKIRWKLLVLLLIMTLLPLLISGIYSMLTTRQLGKLLASQTRELLVAGAHQQLELLVNEYERAQRQAFQLVEAALRVQAREVERYLAAEPVATGRIYLNADYDGHRPVPGLRASDIHFRTGEDGRQVPIQVTYAEQVYFLVDGIAMESVKPDMERLAAMPDVYRNVYDLLPDLIYWQYTALQNGFHSSYPGHGGYPADYDPRSREWYTSARDSGELIWLRPLTEVSTRTIQLAVSMPVFRPDRSFAGVTAMDVPLRGLLNRLPSKIEWGEHIRVSLVLAGDRPGEQALRILADRSYEDRNQDWRRHPDQRYLSSTNTALLETLRERALSGQSGILRLEWQGQDALWAFGGGGVNRVFPVIIVPYETIIRPALVAEQSVVRQTMDDLKAGTLIVTVMVAFASFVAINRSRKLADPIRRVAAAAHELMQGNFLAKVTVDTGDEIQELAEVVNRVGPALEERQRMQRSMELAMDIQQNLLPSEIPVVDGFDISARCVYSEETGGDYYDFVPLFRLGESKLGIALGDVSGHGLPAAMLMASARGVLRSHIELFPNDLSRVFSAMNQYFYHNTPSDRFMTLFLGILDSPSRTLMWASGGQGPVFWFHRETGLVDELEVTGAGLGIMEDSAYKAGGPITLAPGDVLFVGTDGIWETRGGINDDEFGLEGFKQLLKEVSHLTANGIRDAVIETVSKYRGNAPQDDDVTLVVIKAVT